MSPFFYSTARCRLLFALFFHLDGPRGPFNGGEGTGMLGQGPGDLGVDLSGEVWVETPAEDGE